jgi:hypothetical protein
MIKPAKRATIYLDPKIHQILKLKSIETSRSISDIVNDAIKNDLREDKEDLDAFEKRAEESTVTFERMLKQLDQDGKI